ncbi:MAG TPA: flagellar hook-associated protein FlgL [Verrucomicrobiae bacterium]|nr:flagellar hook-associated protein FlgL [Verrucomicrobiae bacterium]
MRVTGNSFTTNFLSQVGKLTARQQQLQTQAATGQRVFSPGDDPAAMQRAMALRAEQGSLSQYNSNIAVLRDRASNAFNSLKSIKTLSDRAGELATLADGTRSPAELTSFATEVSQLIKQAVHTMNAKYGDQHLFGGTAGDQPPFSFEEDANGNVVSVTYHGNTSVPETEIAAGSTLAVDTPGANAAGTGARGVVSDARSGADFFNHLISLQDHLLAADTASIINNDRAALLRDEENFLYQLSNNGVLQSRLETAKTAAAMRSESLEGMLSKEADADLTETLVQLSQAQTSYQAALQSGASLMRLSLMDYLR